MWEITSGPIKLGQVGFFSLGSSQNTQWTQVDQVHVAMVPFGPDYVQSWLIILYFYFGHLPLSDAIDTILFPISQCIINFKEKKKNTKVVFDFGLKGHFLIIFFKTI